MELLLEVLGNLLLHEKCDGMLNKKLKYEMENWYKLGQLFILPYFPLRGYPLTYIPKHVNSQTVRDHRLLLYCPYWHRCGWCYDK